MNENQHPVFEGEAKKTFKSMVRKYQLAIHKNNRDKGFWDGENNRGEKIALIHSELSEALEGIRDGNPLSEKIGESGHSQLEEELADAVIRILDASEAWGLDLAGAIVEKCKYNLKREHMHGRKF